jgi:hypothetical protein
VTYAYYESTDVMTGDNTVLESLGDLCPLGPIDVVDLNAAKTHEIDVDYLPDSAREGPLPLDNTGGRIV